MRELRGWALMVAMLVSLGAGAFGQSHLIAVEEPGHEHLVAARSVLTADLTTTSILELQALASEIGAMIGDKEILDEERASVRKVAVYRMAAHVGLGDSATSGAEALYADWLNDPNLTRFMPIARNITLNRVIMETRCCAQYVPGQAQAIEIARALRVAYPAAGPATTKGPEALRGDLALRVKELEGEAGKLRTELDAVKVDLGAVRKALPLTKD